MSVALVCLEVLVVNNSCRMVQAGASRDAKKEPNWWIRCDLIDFGTSTERLHVCWSCIIILWEQHIAPNNSVGGAASQNPGK